MTRRVNAMCAICELPLVSLQKCVVTGCEVVHRECAMSCRKTRGQKLAERVAELGVETARLARMVALIERDAKVEHRSSVAMGKALLDEREAKEFALDRADDAETARRAALAECVRLRAELAVERDREQVGLASARGSKGEAQEKLAATRDVVEDSDDTAARFRLMELD